MEFSHRPVTGLFFMALLFLAGTAHAQTQCQGRSFEFAQPDNEREYAIEIKAQNTTDDLKSVEMKTSLEKNKVAFLNLTEKVSQSEYYLIDIKGNSGLNQVACEAYKKWKTLITLTPSIPSDVGGAYDGFNDTCIEGHLHLTNLEDNILYHELLHAYLSHNDYQGNPSPLSVYYMRDRDIDEKDFQYANYLSGQELAAFTLQALLYPKRRHENLENLLNITNFAKELQLDTQNTREVLVKVHKGLKMLGLKLQTGEVYFPANELRKKQIPDLEQKEFLIKKFRAFTQINKKIYDILKPLKEPTEFNYVSVSLKDHLEDATEQQALEKIRDQVFYEAIQPGGYLIDFMSWTNTFWLKRK